MRKLLVVAAALVLFALNLVAQQTSVPPPAKSAASGEFASKDAPSADVPHEWLTPCELSGYRTTPRYAETVAYVKRVAAAAPKQVRIESLGKSDEGRDLVAVIVSKDGVFDPQKLHAANRPIVYIQSGIHAGEIEGKDATLALLRDMVITKTRAGLLDRAVVVFVPIYNVDGHERFSPYNRINQNGPEEMGWRTTARNLNLNRDYLKADDPITREFLKFWNAWLPDYFIDNHVTDGADYQYDVTYGVDYGPDAPPAIADWQKNAVSPYIKKSVDEAGHVAGEIAYTFPLEEAAPEKGFVQWPNSPRYSTGYMILQNRPGMLVEMHMLKDYRTRVTGNYELMRALLEVVNRDADKLVKMNRDADAATIAAGRTYDENAKVPIRLAPGDRTEPFDFRGYKATKTLSDVSGSLWVQYTHDPLNVTTTKKMSDKVTQAVATPRAYIVPPQWDKVIDVLAAHGLKIERTAIPLFVEVETYRCDPPKWQERPFEGRHIMAGSGEFSRAIQQPVCTALTEKMTFPANSAVIPMDQRAAKVAMQFLEPMAPDSAVVWGFFDSIFEQKEYGEEYVLEKLAREMMAKDPALKAEFEQRVATDKDFAANPNARLNFFYRRSPWWDKDLGLYPVGRMKTIEGLPIK